MDYEGLKAQVKAYLGRNDLDAIIPQFISLAESRMNRELRLKVMEKYSDTVVPSGQNSIALPDRRVPGDWDVFIEERDLRANKSKLINLEFRGLDSLPQAPTNGTPAAYSVRGRELVLVPTPDSPCELILTYYAEIPPLSAEQPTNEVLLRYPDLYLYAALVESGPYTRSSAPIELWATFYDAARQKANKNDEAGRFAPNKAARPIRSI